VVWGSSGILGTLGGKKRKLIPKTGYSKPAYLERKHVVFQVFARGDELTISTGEDSRRGVRGGAHWGSSRKWARKGNEARAAGRGCTSRRSAVLLEPSRILPKRRKRKLAPGSRVKSLKRGRWRPRPSSKREIRSGPQRVAIVAEGLTTPFSQKSADDSQSGPKKRGVR